MHHEHLLHQLTNALKAIHNLKAIVLGGSYANGSQRPDSDLDLGLYYYADQPLDIAHLSTIAAQLNDTPDPVVTDLGGWGTWVNGGAWLTIEGQRVDFLYRNIDFVSSTLDECNAGTIHSDYWQQPAYGFHSFMYCTETLICRPLYDPDAIIAPLKAKVAVYPPALKQAIIKSFLWNARFTLDNTRKPAARGEVYMVASCLARAIHCLVQVLYALNETYYISEKRLATDVASFNKCPEGFVERIYALLGMIGTNNVRLQEALMEAEMIYDEVMKLSMGETAGL
ncbi:MAG: nucleotidyltransferase domain-containing protein [Ktedonobacteraceae bacterium]|nr:nucleotidyltransferase domain-containing protein [Ktedonobacteraceae bacterium]